MNDEGSEEKRLTDPTYNAADFKVQVAGGGLRWIASILTMVSAGLFLFLAFDDKEPELDFPVHLKGRAVLWVVGSAVAVWLLLAIVNWASWLKSKRENK
jgi:hypothetical protein